MAVTLQTIYDKSRKLTNTNSITWTDANLLVDTNETYLEVCRALANARIEVTGIIAKTDLVADQEEYQLPSDLFELVRLEINYDDPNDYTKWRKLSSSDLPNLPEVWAQFVRDNTQGATTADIFGDHIRVAPRPSTAKTLALRLWYIQKKADFALAADSVPHPFNLYWDTFAWGNAWKYYEPKNKEEADRKRVGFNSKLQEMIAGLKDETLEPIKSSVPNYFNNGWM